MSNTNNTVIEAKGEFAQARDLGLVRRAQSGDVDAFREIYEQHIGKVYALCYRLCADKSLADDAAQEVFIQLWNKLDSYAEQSKFSTWLHSVTANVTISYIRKQKGWWQKMMNLEDAGADNWQGDTSAESVDFEALIMRLPERARMVFVLHALEGYRHEDIANMLKMAVGSSKAQFHRAKQLLKSWMGEDDE